MLDGYRLIDERCKQQIPMLSLYSATHNGSRYQQPYKLTLNQPMTQEISCFTYVSCWVNDEKDDILLEFRIERTAGSRKIAKNGLRSAFSHKGMFEILEKHGTDFVVETGKDGYWHIDLTKGATRE